MSRLYGQIFLAAIFLLVAGQLSLAASGNQTMKLKDIAVGKVVQVGNAKFVKVAGDQYLALDLCPTGSTYSSFYKGCVVKTTDFAYTGGEQTFTAPADGYYVLEVWGGAAGFNGYGANQNNTYGAMEISNYTLAGGGGYAVGAIDTAKSTTLYVNVGGGGKNCGRSNAYNGGGMSGTSGCSSGGGGATHIALVSGVLANLSAYKDTGGPNVSREILIVAGGGGGGYTAYPGKSGGGISGNNGTASNGGTQTSGGSGYQDGGFGYGGSADTGDRPGGGGGWYGGGSGQSDQSAGGGSGYIGSSNLLSLPNFPKHMTCRDCTTSTNSNTYTISNTCFQADSMPDCAKRGHGAARITQLSVYLGI